MASSYEMGGAARIRADFLKEQRKILFQEHSQYKAEIERLQDLFEKNQQEMSSYLLGEVTNDEILAVEKKLHYPSLMAIKREVEKELYQRQNELKALMQDHEAANVELYLSQARDEREEIADTHERVVRTLDIWQKSVHFQKLDGRGYFDSGYKVGFFGWFRDWKDVSLLMGYLEKNKEDTRYKKPKDLQQDWLSLKAESDPILELWQNLEQREEELTKLQNRRIYLEQSPTRLFKELYDKLSEAIARHLETMPEPQLLDLAKNDKNLTAFLYKNSGLQKQFQYLEELRIRRIQPEMQKLEQEISRLNRKIEKYFRKSKYVSDTDLAKMRNLKADKWAKRHAKNQKMRERISSFHKYEKGSFTRDYLWWDLFTNRAPADDIYEVLVFREQNPSFDYKSYHGAKFAQQDASNAMDYAADALVDSFGYDDDSFYDAS